MARRYARIATSIWDDPDFVDLTPGAQRCYLFLLSQKDMPLTGVLVQRSKWRRSGRGYDDLEDDLAELMARDFVLVDNDTDEVLIRTFMRHDGVLTNAKLRTGARARAGAIHSPRLRAVVEQQLSDAEADSDTEALVDDPSDALCDTPSDDPCDGVPDAPRTSLPRAVDPPTLQPEAHARAERAILRAGQTAHEAERDAGRVKAVTAHGIQKHLESCIDTVRTKDGARLLAFAERNPQWSTDVLVAALSRRTVPASESNHPVIAAERLRAMSGGEEADEPVADVHARVAEAKAAAEAKRRAS